MNASVLALVVVLFQHTKKVMHVSVFIKDFLSVYYLFFFRNCSSQYK